MKLVLTDGYPNSPPKGNATPFPPPNNDRGPVWVATRNEILTRFCFCFAHCVGFFLTKIYHPNIAANGDICVNTLKKDWTPELGIAHVLQVIRCLLIVPFPESSLNDEAGKMFMEDYESYANRAKLMTSVHATKSCITCQAADVDEDEGGENSDGLINQADPQGSKAATKAVVKVKVDKNKTAKKKSLKRL